MPALRLGLVAVLGAAYLWLGYSASISEDPPLLGLLVALAPLSFSAVVLAWHSRSLGLQALCATAFILMLVYLDFLRANTAWVYFIQHAGMHTLLGIMFGRTLFAGHKAALCSQISSFVYQDTLSPVLFRYSWRVTCAWTVYFAGCTVVSALLFFFGPLTVWSFFANLLTPVLIGSIFVVEFFTRRLCLPDLKHISIAQTIQAYHDYTQPKPAAAAPPAK